MTISTRVNRWAYTGDAASKDFSYANKIFDASDLEVYVDGTLKTLTTDYSVSGVGSAGGGTVSFVAAPASGASVVLVRAVPATQEVDYQEADPFPAETHEGALDKLTVLIQQLEDRQFRALQLALSDAATSIGALPDAASRASKWLAFDAAGAPVAATPTDPSALAVSAFIETLLDDADQPTALATLGALARAAASQTVQLDDNGAGEGPVIELDRLSATPAASDLLGAIVFTGRSDAGTKRVLAKLSVLLADATDGSEDALLRVRTIVAGTLGICASFGAGLAVGSSAVDPGAGLVNAEAGYQRNGVALPIQRSVTLAATGFSNGASVAIAHGLPVTPRRRDIHWQLKCVDAGGEVGYAQNEYADSVSNYDGAATHSIVVIGIDATNITLRIGANGAGTSHKSTGASVGVTASKWNIVVTVDY